MGTAEVIDDLQQIQRQSERRALPEQEKVFAVAKRVRSRLSNLPDPTHPPLGWVKGRAFDDVFPFIRLPELRPALNGDWVQFGTPNLEPNRLYFGDNLQVLRTLPSESIDLIYIDPPFFSGAQYNTIWGDANEVRTFNDIWDGGIDTYLVWLNARLWEMRRVLKSTGSVAAYEIQRPLRPDAGPARITGLYRQGRQMAGRRGSQISPRKTLWELNCNRLPVSQLHWKRVLGRS